MTTEGTSRESEITVQPFDDVSVNFQRVRESCNRNRVVNLHILDGLNRKAICIDISKKGQNSNRRSGRPIDALFRFLVTVVLSL